MFLYQSLRCTALIAGFACFVSGASAQYFDLHNFGPSDSPPVGVPVVDSSGTLIGTCYKGGANNGGFLWAIDTSGGYRIVRSFGAGQDGSSPGGRLVMDGDGNLFGVCWAGGRNGYNSGGYSYGGTVWEIDTTGAYRVLHDFGAAKDGLGPGDMIRDAAGNLLGTCGQGGAYGSGMIWKIDKSGAYHDLYDFHGQSDGTAPPNSIAVDASGNLFGTCATGGSKGLGIAWKIDNSGTFHVLHNFTGVDGYNPPGPVALDAIGNLFGTCQLGSTYGWGNLWKITPQGAFQILHVFGRGLDGLAPDTGAFIDSLGNLYGTCNWSSITGRGCVWEFDRTGRYQKLHDFLLFSDGAGPNGVGFDSLGNLYGSCRAGGPTGGGLAWEFIVPAALKSFSLTPLEVVGPIAATGMVTLSKPAPTGGVSVVLSSNNTAATVPASVTVPAGKTQATFPITTVTVGARTVAGIKATYGGFGISQSLKVDPPQISALSLSPSPVQGGQSVLGKVSIAQPAPMGGATITLRSNRTTVAKVPDTVTIPAGQTTASFTVTTVKVGSKTSVTITAILTPVSSTATLSVTP